MSHEKILHECEQHRCETFILIKIKHIKNYSGLTGKGLTFRETTGSTVLWVRERDKIKVHMYFLKG